MRLKIFLTFSEGFRVFEAHFLIKSFLIKKRGLHLNFCRGRNMTNNGNQTITKNDGNNDNASNSSNRNDVSDKIESQEKF